jgi:hypothetical protein
MKFRFMMLVLGLVWRETGAVRNARPSRGRAASTRKKTERGKCAMPPLRS